MNQLVNHNDTLSALKTGDRAAFELLFKSMYKRLVGYAYQFIKDKDQCEELVQDAFYHIWAKRAEIEINSSVQAYLFSAVRNKALNEIAHQKVVQLHRQEAVEDEPHEQNPLEQTELGELIAKAVEKLPLERRKVFYMSKYEGKKFKEIADELGISIKTVENQMGKALKFLLEELVELVSVLIFIFLQI